MLLQLLSSFVNHIIVSHNSYMTSIQSLKKRTNLQYSKNNVASAYRQLCASTLSLQCSILVFFFLLSYCLWFDHGASLSSFLSLEQASFCFIHSAPLLLLLLLLLPCILWKIKPCQALLWCARTAWCLTVMDTIQCLTVNLVVLEFS